MKTTYREIILDHLDLEYIFHLASKVYSIATQTREAKRVQKAYLVTFEYKKEGKIVTSYSKRFFTSTRILLNTSNWLKLPSTGGYFNTKTL